ncbi:glycosyltransferase [Desulfobacter postgatei]|uniref:glycosyltransferase n=1 Tax=Desulfobacter postgatei TaxID=2293 RepID=UPI00259BDA34|nr:glycosyltransferase [uncultured Desulfobacter sp.]
MNAEIAPLISVIMGVYNGEKYVSRAVESILNQTYKNFEFIIINDGSTDNTKKILESYSDQRIRLFHQENIGLTKTLNKGLEKARGEFIARQDADDISHRSRLERQVRYLERRPDINLAGTHINFIDKNGKRFSTWRPPETHSDILNALTRYNCFCHGSVIFRKSCLEKTGPYNEFFLYTQDYDLWCRIAECFKVTNIPEVLYDFRKEAGTISRKKLSTQLDYHFLTIVLSKERIKKKIGGLTNLPNMSPFEILKKIYGFSYFEINKFKSQHYLSYFKEALKMKDYFYALSLWTKSFFMFPCKASWKTLIASVYEIALSGRK